MPMQFTAIFHSCKNDNLSLKLFDCFLMFSQNTLEPPHLVLSPITIDVLFLNQQKWEKNSSQKNVPCARVDELELLNMSCNESACIDPPVGQKIR